MGKPIKAAYFGTPKGTGTGGEGVASIAVTGTNNNYTVIPTVGIAAPNVAGGVQAVASVTSMGVVSAVVVDGGTGYTNGDVLTVVGGTGTVAMLTVATSTLGVIDTVTVSDAGAYTVLPTGPVSVTDGTGTLATFTLTYKVNAVTVTTAGTGYTAAPAVTPSVGNATLTATLTTGTLNAILISAWVVGGSSAVAGDIVAQKGSRRYKVTTAQGTSVCKLVTGVPAAGEMNIVATCSATHDKYASTTFNVAKLTAHLAYDEDGVGYRWSFDTAAGQVVSIANQ